MLPAKASDGFGRRQFEKLENGSYLIMSAGRPWMSLTGSGTSVYPYATNTGSSQQWQITTTPPQAYSQAIESGLYYIKNLYENKYLTHDTKIEVNDYAASSAQRWRVFKNTDNTYTIYLENDLSHGIGIYGGLAVDEQVLSCSVGNSIASQKMCLIDQGNGSYSLVPATNSIYRVGIYTDMSETKTIGGVAQTMLQNKTACLELNSSSNTQKWVFEATTDKKAVILIHGRTDNSFNCFGANNSILADPFNSDIKDNNHYSHSVDALSAGIPQLLYTDVSTQLLKSYMYNEALEIPTIFNGKFENGVHVNYDSDGEYDGNLAYYLKQNGYIENVNLFVFNYPNEDLVIYNAQKFNVYIENLVSYAISSGSSEMKHALAINGDDYSFNIVGHSMGGLVARYYIENLGQHEHVDKLITIDTPHWGSDYADLSNITDIMHKMYDHDLENHSALFDATEDNVFTCLYCEVISHSSTDYFNYQASRITKYYAIAGINYDAAPISINNLTIDLPTNFSSCTELSNYIQEQANNNLYTLAYAEDDDEPLKYYMSVNSVDDNIVGFLSQIGWLECADSSSIQKINLEKAFVLIDTNGGNSLLDRLHSKMQHRTPVMEKVKVYLEE